MKKEHTKAIQELISAYCAEHKLTPRNHQLVIELSFRPTPTTIVSFQKYSIGDIDPKILSSEMMDYDAAKMLRDYLESIKCYKPSAARIVNSLAHLIGKNNPTVREVVYFSDLDDNWLKHRNLAFKGLQHIDNWLGTLGLKRLPAPPH